MRSDERRVQHDVAGLQRQHAALRHRVACVYRQIDQEMFQLRHVRHDGHERLSEPRLDSNRFTQEASQHGLQIAGDIRQIHHLDCEHLLATEGQQLPRQHRGPFSGSLNLAKVLSDELVRPDLPREKLGIPQNRGQHVVEVVRHTASELPDSLHLLRLAQLFVQPVLLGDVLDDDLEDGRARVLPMRQTPIEADPDLVSRLSPPDGFGAGETALFDETADELGTCGRVEIEVAQSHVNHFPRRVVSQHRHEGRIDFQKPAGDGRLIDAEHRMLDERAVLPLRLAKSVLGLDPVTSLDDFPQLPFDSRDQSGQATLDHEVVRAGLQRADCCLLPDRARDDDERKVEAC